MLKIDNKVPLLIVKDSMNEFYLIIHATVIRFIHYTSFITVKSMQYRVTTCTHNISSLSYTQYLVSSSLVQH